MLTPAFNEIMSGYTSRSNMALNHTECGETCTATVKVPQLHTLKDTQDILIM